MKIKKLKVVLKSGTTYPTEFDTVTEAIKTVGINDVSKIIEVNIDAPKKIGHTYDKDSILVISKRSNEDLEKSLSCGYTVTYNKPSSDRVFEGMTMVETSEDKALIGKFVSLRNWDPGLHKDFIPPGYRPDKDWEWAIYNRDAKIVDREELEKTIGKIPGVQGGIGYHTPNKD